MNKLKELRIWLLRKRVVWGLKRANRKAIEVEKVMEQFATNSILTAESPDAVGRSRQVLVHHQNTISVKSDFQDFLETL